MVESAKVVLLTSDGTPVGVVFNELKRRFNVVGVVVEDKVPRSVLLKRRVQKLGLVKVCGQVIFMLSVIPLLRASSKHRISQIIEDAQLNDSMPDGDCVFRVPSVNDEAAIDFLRRLEPDVVVVNGTRIISENVLNSVAAKFINIHAGITPLYRGVHGGYWSLVQGRRDACGVTIHLVDKGIDTGQILGQAIVDVTPKDNFLTYPWLQVVAGLPLLMEAVQNAASGQCELRPAPDGVSKLWSHPTIFEYVWYMVTRRVK